METSLEFLRVASGVMILLYASSLDWKYREIDDKSWLSLIALGIFFFAYEFMRDPSRALPFFLSIASTSALVALLYYPGIICGGDAKILIGISALAPVPFHFSVIPLFSLGVLVNAVVLSSLIPMALFAYNLRRIREIKNIKDFLVLFLGYKKRGEDIKKHEAVIAKDGEYNLFISGRKIQLGIKAQGEVWVSPAIPFVIPLTMGFVISAIFGDFLSYVLLAM